MSIYVSPVFEINDINGAPQVGAKLVFYTPGTTNLKTIYSDADFGTPRTNPVTAVSSSAGAIYPIIYLDGLYDVVQQDSAGTVDTDDGATIWTRDDIGPISTGQFDLWLNDTTYSIPEIVLGSNDEYYRSLADANQGNNPTTDATKWEQLRLGRIWNTNITYSIGDSVYGSDGHLYVARVSQSGNDPLLDPTNWETGPQLVLNSVTAGITADAGSAQGGSPLVSEINEVSTVATIGDAVTLPDAVPGYVVYIINNGANAMDIFPASGDDLGQGTDIADSLTTSRAWTFVCWSTSTWQRTGNSS